MKTTKAVSMYVIRILLLKHQTGFLLSDAGVVAVLPRLLSFQRIRMPATPYKIGRWVILNS